MSDFTFETIINTSGLFDAFRRPISRVVDQASEGITTHMHRAFREPKTGKIYRRRDADGGIRIHQASKKGEAPAIDSELLDESILVKPISDTEKEIEKEIEIGTSYADILENLLDRPYVKPAIDDTVAAINRGGIIPRAA